MGIKIRVTGDLRKASDAAVAKIGAALVRSVSDETDAVAAEMRQRAPVGDARRGRRGRPPLRGSITATSSRLRGRAKVKARHANIVEHGTETHPAQPFVRPAAISSRRRFPDRAVTEVRKALGR